MASNSLGCLACHVPHCLLSGSVYILLVAEDSDTDREGCDSTFKRGVRSQFWYLIDKICHFWWILDHRIGEIVWRIWLINWIECCRWTLGSAAPCSSNNSPSNCSPYWGIAVSA